MQLPYYKFLFLSAFVSSFTKAQPDTINSVDIIEKLIQDLESSPSGYTFHRHSTDVHPGRYDADVNHGKAKIAAKVGLETISSKRETRPDTHTGGESLDMIQTYKSTGGYSFVISHDYGGTKNHAEVPIDDDPHYGASNADFQSIALVNLNEDDSDHLSTYDVGNKNEGIQPGGNEGLGSYDENERYGSYIEYDEAVKNEKKGSSVNPEEYYEVDVDSGNRKYNSDDRNGEFDNHEDKESYLGFLKYDESDDYGEYGNYDSLKGQGIDANEEHLQLDKYKDPEEYSKITDSNGVKKTESFGNYYRNDDGDEYEKFKANFGKKYTYPDEYSKISDSSEVNEAELIGSYNKNDETDEYEKFKANYDNPINNNENFGERYTHIKSNDYNTKPENENTKDYLMSDFFKDYNYFFNGGNEQTNHENDLKHEDGYYNDHDTEDASNLYKEDSKEAKDFFDDADSFGNHNEKGNGEVNSNFGEKRGHKKGSKTTGYHNVLHKDEYTKDHTFYVNAKNNGHFNKEGDYDAHNYRHEEDHEDASNSYHSSNGDHHDESDSEAKGHSFGDNLSNNNENDYETDFYDNSDYSNEGNDKYGKKYGDNLYDSNSYFEY